MRAELVHLRKMGIEPIPNYTPVIADNGGPCLYDKVAETFHLGATSGFWDVGEVGKQILQGAKISIW